MFAVNIGDEGKLQLYSEKEIEESTARELFTELSCVDNQADLLNRITVSVLLPAAKFSPPRK